MTKAHNAYDIAARCRWLDSASNSGCCTSGAGPQARSVFNVFAGALIGFSN